VEVPAITIIHNGAHNPYRRAEHNHTGAQSGSHRSSPPTGPPQYPLQL